MPWVKGQSGNPAGRKPGTRIARVELERQLQLLTSDGSGQTQLQVLIRKVIEQAIQGEHDQQKLVLDRVDPAKFELAIEETVVEVVRAFAGERPAIPEGGTNEPTD